MGSWCSYLGAATNPEHSDMHRMLVRASSPSSEMRRYIKEWESDAEKEELVDALKTYQEKSSALSKQYQSQYDSLLQQFTDKITNNNISIDPVDIECIVNIINVNKLERLRVHIDTEQRKQTKARIQHLSLESTFRNVF